MLLAMDYLLQQFLILFFKAINNHSSCSSGGKYNEIISVYATGGFAPKAHFEQRMKTNIFSFLDSQNRLLFSRKKVIFLNLSFRKDLSE
jgi:hypothetical protein